MTLQKVTLTLVLSQERPLKLSLLIGYAQFVELAKTSSRKSSFEAGE